jgi:predicted transposase/invertase (TIGR01784 family)
MRKIQFFDEDDPVDIRKDNVFKAVFTKDSPASRGALSKLVSALIDREVTVSSILSNEPPVENLRDRKIRFDIKCKAENGDLINVEMSFDPKPSEMLRLEFYACRLYTGQDIMGSDRSYNDLNRAYQIAILAKEQFFPDEAFIHSFEYYDPVCNTTLNGRSRIITVELSKVEELAYKPTKAMSSRENWAIYFRYLTDKSKRLKINEIVQAEEGIAMASEVLLTISKDEIERARLESELKYMLDTHSDLVEARREGRREGRQEGKLEGLIEGHNEVLNMLAQKLPKEEIEEIKQRLVQIAPVQ